jgi:hypothetical protein
MKDRKIKTIVDPIKIVYLPHILTFEDSIIHLN